MQTPTTLLEAVTFFSNPDTALEYAVKTALAAWRSVPASRLRLGVRQFIKTRKLWRCKECKRQFTVKVATIFEDSPIPLAKWLSAIWLLANTKNGTVLARIGASSRCHAKDRVVHVHRFPSWTT